MNYADLLTWYEGQPPRVLAVTRCPQDNRRIAVVYALDDQLYVWDAGYRMTVAESRREVVALEVSVHFDAYDAPPSDEEWAEIQAAADGTRIDQQPRVRPLLHVLPPFERDWPLLPEPRPITTCQRCRTSYELDTSGLREGAQRRESRPPVVPPLRKMLLTKSVEERMAIAAKTNEWRSRTADGNSVL